MEEGQPGAAGGGRPFRSRDYEEVSVALPPGLPPGASFAFEYRPGRFVDVTVPKKGLFGGAKHSVPHTDPPPPQEKKRKRQKKLFADPCLLVILCASPPFLSCPRLTRTRS